ncbi:hypothetical protein BAUCODRAFT_25924 [Baudoinia panamericana UAMH 10762]|uniref:Endonuclease/exonuclease/phosphatase domain-containing protein n=1 Tax=Baudoinia panamericana (strain UAMH 10762) TaxID=717646 RepID=M2N7N4_BAUPA|nr:uncharacterized protein BAUCODRAFT_25924 [Baudoinia panamericana UAMH 10762]EMC94815.1 hypothetical protein BAUCODRAFT_25924 [Baudoinia panamericana UAMH 10762]
MKFLSLAALSASIAACVSAITIAEINGNRFISPYKGQTVTGVQGLVTAKGPNGFWIRSTTPDTDDVTSESIYVYGRAGLPNATVGNVVSLNGRVTEYRSTSTYLYLTEIDTPKNITTLSTGNTVTPLQLGQQSLISTLLGKTSLNPPTQQYTSLDNGDVFGLPGNTSLVSVANPVLQPKQYGLDFWESINGELVTIKNPSAISRPNTYGETWVIGGNWIVTGKNSRGSLTATPRDGNPEGIIIGDPLDGTDNPKDVKLGDQLADITGIVTYTYGFYYVLPTTKITITTPKQPEFPPPTRLTSSGRCSGITIGQYNVENLSPQSALLDDIAQQIVTYLKTPDLLFVQEIQDDNGATNNGVVNANVTLSTLTAAINAAGSKVNYSYVDIDPVNNQDGGQPGGNIRVAYLYNPAVIRPHNPNPGSSTDANEVLPGPELKYNPGRIDPANPAWVDSRKPLAAAWETLDGKNKFFTVNVHWIAKLGGSSIQGDARPPTNGGVDERHLQAQVTGNFIAQILAQDRNAAVIAAGDYNEFSWVEPLQTFASVSGLKDLDDATLTPPLERYTYTFGANTEQLDHMYVSPKVALLLPQFEHVHVSSWVTDADVVSDHDPSVAKLNVCAGLL